MVECVSVCKEHTDWVRALTVLEVGTTTQLWSGSDDGSIKAMII